MERGGLLWRLDGGASSFVGKEGVVWRMLTTEVLGMGCWVWVFLPPYAAYLYLEEVLGWAIDLFKALLSSIRQRLHLDMRRRVDSVGAFDRLICLGGGLDAQAVHKDICCLECSVNPVWIFAVPVESESKFPIRSTLLMSEVVEKDTDSVWRWGRSSRLRLTSEGMCSICNDGLLRLLLMHAL